MVTQKLLNRVNQQETLVIEGSSETVRGITFDFENYVNVKPRHKKNIDINFIIWFIGFVEGDGSFVVSNNKVYFDLTQHLRDIALLYQIKTTLGFGSVLTRTDGHREVGVYYITGKDNFARLIHLFNGNLVCDFKKQQFKVWLDVYNKQYSQCEVYKQSVILPSFHNAWLSGFIDAEGCFSARVKKCKTSKAGVNLFVDFSLAHKDKQILSHIKHLLNILTNSNIVFDRSWNGYRFYLSNKKRLICLINYLKCYKLKTKKNIDFFIWGKIHHLGIIKEHLTPLGLFKIKKLISSIRTYD